MADIVTLFLSIQGKPGGSEMNGFGESVPPERSHRAIAVTDVTVHTMDGRGDSPLRLAMRDLVVRGTLAGLWRSVRNVHRQTWRGGAVADSPI